MQEELSGTLLPILTFPHPKLTKKSLPFTAFGTKELDQLIKDMLTTMYKAPGIGLAAPQIGQNIRLFVVDVDYEREKKELVGGETFYEYSQFNPYVFINPKITVLEGDDLIYKEGCLSVPEVYEEVTRPGAIRVDYQDKDGNPQTLEADDLLAICIQHEYDHLEGKLFLDRLSLLKRNFLKKKMIKEKSKKEAGLLG